MEGIRMNEKELLEWAFYKIDGNNENE